MSEERNRAMAAASALAAGKTRAGKAANRAKLEASRPHIALRDSWVVAVRLAHGSAPGTEWGPAELSLAKKCLKEAPLDDLLRDMHYFIDSWCPPKNHFPSFRLFWAVRGKIHGEATGRMKPTVHRRTKDERLGDGEYDAEEAKGQPKLGLAKRTRVTE